MNLKELERPFGESLIRTRKGSHGKTLSYVPSAEYVRRLNEASENTGAWDWELLEYKILDNEVVVLGKLTIDGTIKIEFGGSSITRATSDNSIISLASDLKSASSDALKRCCMRAGLGLQFYTGTTAQSPQNSQSPQSSQSAQQSQTSTPSRLVPTTTITPNQLRAIQNMSSELGLSIEELHTRCNERFDCNPEGLSRRDASALITELGEELDANRKRLKEFNRSRGAA